MQPKLRIAIITGIALGCATSHVAIAQDYPNRPIRFVVGPGPDVLARMMGQKLTERWGQQVVVDQRPGAGGIIAAETVAKASPDGYTLLLTTGAYTINAVLYPKLPFNLERDFAPVDLLATISFLVIVPNSLPVKTMQDLLQLARAKPGSLNCAHSGPGTTAHLGCEMLKKSAGIDIVSVPYKGTVPAIIDVIAGQAQLMFAVNQGAVPYVKAGKLRAVAVTGPKRLKALPDVPTISGGGAPGADIITWNGVHVPAKTPKAVVAKLNEAFNAVLRMPDVQERMEGLGLDRAGGTPEEFRKFVHADLGRWAKAVKETGVRAE